MHQILGLAEHSGQYIHITNSSYIYSVYCGNSHFVHHRIACNIQAQSQPLDNVM